MKIPVTFQFEGRQVTGSLSEVHGAGTASGEWQLIVGGYYRGRLRRSADQWFFDESNWAISHLKDYFVEVVISWYQ